MDDLSPTWGGLGYSLRRFYIDRFYRRWMAAVPAGSVVLDIGGYRESWRGQVRVGDYPVRVVALNLVLRHRADVQADAGMLPCRDESVDVVVCCELLEHVLVPLVILAEIARVLRPGGRLLACAPFLVPIHDDPEDYGRYTDTYWGAMLERAGFRMEACEAQGSLASVVVDLLRGAACARYAGSSVRARAVRRLLTGMVFRWAKRVAVARDARGGPRPVTTTGFGLVAVKP